jgi:predicted branched-subunit amino acid permease
MQRQASKWQATHMEPAHRVRDGARRVAPLAVAVGAFGITYGVLAQASGFGALETLVFSATPFAGSAQFVAAAVLAATMLNARYLPIGLSVAPAMRGGRLERFLRAQLVVDEAWAVSHLGKGRYDAQLLLGAGLTLYLSWVVGTLLGIVGGDALGDPKDLGLDAAFPALFLALLAGQIKGRLGAVAAVLGAAVALALVPFVPVGIPIVAAAVVCLLGARR